MVDSSSNVKRIHPDELLLIITPLHLKLLHANRADARLLCWIIWNWDPLELRIVLLLDLLSLRGELVGAGEVALVNLAGTDPVLKFVNHTLPGHDRRMELTSSSTNQLLCWPLVSASSIR